MEINEIPSSEFQLNESEENPFWLSVGDLMSGLLMVFVLLLLVVLHQMYKEQEQQKGTRSKILHELKVSLQKNNIQVIVDQQNGTITIKDNVLFASGKSKLRVEGEAFLSRFTPLYSKVLFSNKRYRNEIVRIVVEGHTDKVGDFNENMQLSSQRSYQVIKFILGEELEYPHKKELTKRILCAGRGEIDADQNKANSSDRKVVFRIQFRDLRFLDIWGKLLKEK